MPSPLFAPATQREQGLEGSQHCPTVHPMVCTSSIASPPTSGSGPSSHWPVTSVKKSASRQAIVRTTRRIVLTFCCANSVENWANTVDRNRLPIAQSLTVVEDLSAESWRQRSQQCRPPIRADSNPSIVRFRTHESCGGWITANCKQFYLRAEVRESEADSGLLRARTGDRRR